MQQKTVELTRAELYERVWSKPVIHLAKDYGISGVGLAKICKKHNVPTPPLGYWSKVKAGQRVRKKPLPALKTDDELKIRIGPYRAHVTGEDKRSIPDEFQLHHLTATERALYFNAEDEPTSPHPLTKWARKSFKKATSVASTLNCRVKPR